MSAHTIAVAAGLIVFGAIAGCSDADRAPMLSPSLAELQVAGENEVNVVVLGRGRFIIDGESVTGMDELESMLRARRSDANTVVLYLHEDLDEGSKGFNALLAINAAALAGYAEARGYDGFNEEGRASGSTLRPLAAVTLKERAVRLRAEAAADSQPHPPH